MLLSSFGAIPTEVPFVKIQLSFKDWRSVVVSLISYKETLQLVFLFNLSIND